MTTHRGPRQKESADVLEERVRALEGRVTVLTEALRVLAHGLEDLPAAEPGGQTRAAKAARQAYELLLAAPGSQRE